MSRVQPGSGYGLPKAAPANSKSGTDWLLVSSMTLALSIIIYVLWAVVMPRAFDRAELARENAARHDIRVLSAALENFRLDCGRYPTTDEGLEALRSEPAESHGWKGPYVDHALPRDPWHHPYHYEYPTGDAANAFVVESYGADGLPGGTGANADISVQDE